jgi:hypothetical protein
MYDSIYTTQLPAGGNAYLGYVDGLYPTVYGYTPPGMPYQPPLAQLFPGVPVVSLTVTGNTLDADGCDIEALDLTPTSGAQWLTNKLATSPAMPPVAYCSVDSMAGVVNDLAALGVPRTAVRLLSSHYGAGEHICGPDSCGLIAYDMDGTQWTDVYDGDVDASLLNDSFLGAPPTPSGEEDDMQLGQYQTGGTPATTAQIVAVIGATGYVYTLEQAAPGGAWTLTGNPAGGTVPLPLPVDVALQVVDNVPNLFIQCTDPIAADNGDVYTSVKQADGTWAGWVKL